MRRDSHRLQVLDAFRAHVEATGSSPTCRELGTEVGISHVAAWKHRQALVADGLLMRLGREVMLPGSLKLRTVPTDQLRGELARRGVTMDALEQPKLLWDEGNPCAANHCMERVKPGQLFCRDHWFGLPVEMRSSIFSAWRTRNRRRYQEAVEAARDHLGGFTRVVERV